MASKEEMVKIKEVHLESDPSSGRVIILKEGGGQNRYLTMVVGDSEFAAIAKEKGLIASSRPLTHEMYLSIIETLDVEFVRVEISHLKDNTYHAMVIYRSKGVEHAVDSRPSDAIALALKRKIPILANAKLFRPVLAEQHIREYRGFMWRVEF